ncbi:MULTISPECIES: Asp-tRNA(Asn)/Glu-tRNA(Gln) amidotransferase subunit GatC [Alteribacter]|uniref:Aspartyl/glutamyl-tRNA(Asn/Gln) amidotransferase subunit C n=1 Tax=Alteribacter keqinensis TaxID=2483800 RepID=A0A3M7TMX7_9BACI|nr:MULTISPECIES: Asp-tRNA(Asn)/Glu-tRNA(Gln) amidotransferase subunit GatC [Alteribacter]MBM7094932.1 Asp-tRNA(Asn)/Glu-tRNA(Gln) amidotransferase subunit GatC [Alteribacter salitolerans]RNA66738.1 Asp-tRNA(Asn)/Glu-tRNA(Gln) amidotransferase subunit GatC [Alteribacter keqinensis]
MERITKAQIKHVAHLARLEFTDHEVEMFSEQLDSIINYAEQLNELDTTNVKPTSHVFDVKNVLREDEVKPSLSQEDALKNAPDQKDGQVKIPSVFEK